MREGSPPWAPAFWWLAFLKTPTFSISKRGVLVSARIRGSLTFFGSYAKFSVVGLTNVVVDYGTLNLLLLLFPTRDHNLGS
jgi:hypothetical protein